MSHIKMDVIPGIKVSPYKYRVSVLLYGRSLAVISLLK